MMRSNSIHGEGAGDLLGQEICYSDMTCCEEVRNNKRLLIHGRTKSHYGHKVFGSEEHTVTTRQE